MVAEGINLPAQKTSDAPKSRAPALARAVFAPLLLCLAFASNSTESAIANGETRTISLSSAHTNEAGSFTYMVNGTYDSAVLDKLNWFLRDWRHDEKTTMDPRLFDLVWEVYRESGSSEPIDVLSAYRSPETNAMLRRRSRQVAEHSQHMMGKAIDAHFLDVPTSKIRDIAMRLQAGGVGFYPTGNTPWIHIDSGSVRYWPRMSHDQIARLFPDGKTVFIPSDGVPLPGYQQAAAEIEARGGAIYAMSGEAGGSKNLLAMLFGGGEDDEEENGQSPRRGGAAGVGGRGATSAQPFFTAQNQTASPQPELIASARHDSPRVDTFLRSPDTTPTAAIVVSSQSQKLEAIAAVEQPDAGAANILDAAPLPPRRPSELALVEAGLSDAPTPPARPIEFASAPEATPLASVTIDSERRNDLIAALLARQLPSVITRGADGAVPSGALALAEFEADAPERPAALARAAALAAPLRSVDWTRLSLLARAALLSAPLSPARAAPKGVLVAARIDRSNFTVMTAAPAKAPAKPSVGPRIVAVAASARPDALMAMLTPNVQAPAAFAAQPYGDLRSDAFTGPAVKPLGASFAPGDAMNLRGPAD
jgi:uncharacterized protein YcbK (DUF882 family)